MKNISGPFYHIDEAQEILGVRKSELVHLIREKEIQCVAYTKARNMLLFLRDKDGKWTGLAKCLYRGHLTLHLSFVERMFDGDKIAIETGSGRLLEENGILNWNSEYPFKKLTPHGIIESWISADRDRFKLTQLAATPFPRETITLSKSLENIFDAFNFKPKPSTPGTIQLSQSDRDNPEDQVLDFKTLSGFDPTDLRIPASEIAKYQNASEPEESHQSDSISSSELKKDSSRENQLHTLIERLIDTDPTISAKQAWSLLEKDWDKDEPEFDTDHIIQRMDSQCIEWQSRYGKERSINWSSFQPLVSKLKKKRSSH